MCQIKVSASAYMGDFCAGHFVAGFSLGGWQGRSDSPTGAQDRQRAAAAKWAGSRPNKPNGQETQGEAGPIILSSSELRCKTFQRLGRIRTQPHSVLGRQAGWQAGLERGEVDSRLPASSRLFQAKQVET